MALSPSMFIYLMAASRAGVDFTRLATIGKQDYKTTRHELPPICRAFGLTETPDDIVKRCKNDVDQFYGMIGAQSVDSIDASDFEGATIIHDMNQPIPGELHERFSTVVDIGCIEHIFNFPQTIKNYMEMVEVGGHLIVITSGNNLLGHGLYQFSPDLFYRVLSPENGYRVVGMHLCLPYFYPPKFYAVRDPAAIRNRTELTNDQPVDIMVIARRERIAPVLDQPVQQSDYTVVWSGGVRQPLAPGRQPLKRRVKAAVRKVVSERAKVAIKRSLGMSYAPAHGFDQACFRHVSLEELAAGGVIDREASAPTDPKSAEQRHA